MRTAGDSPSKLNTLAYLHWNLKIWATLNYEFWPQCYGTRPWIDLQKRGSTPASSHPSGWQVLAKETLLTKKKACHERVELQIAITNTSESGCS